MSFNPYHQWLGLDPKIKHPHYFQLLGVSSQIRDSLDFNDQVIAAAQARLAQLKPIDAGDRASLLEQLKKRIVLARDVLSDDQRRVEYVRKLKADIEATQKKRSDVTAPAEAAQNSTVRNPPSEPNIKSVPEQIAPTSPQPANAFADDLSPPTASPAGNLDSAKPITGQPAVAQPISTSAAVPIADPKLIPMAVPIGIPSFPSAGLPPNPAIQIPDSVDGFSQESNAFDAGPSIRPIAQQQKKRSGILAGIFLLAVTGITVAGFYFFMDRLLPPNVDNSNPVVNPVANPDLATTPTETGGHLKPIYPALNGHPHVEHPANSDSDPKMRTREKVLRNQDPFNMPTDGLSAMIDETIDHSGSPDLTDPPNSNLDASGAGTLEPVKVKKPFSEMQVLEIRWRLQQIRRSLLRRDPDSIIPQLQRTKRIFDEWLADGEFELPTEQQRLLDHFNASQQALSYVDGFWALVIKNCQQLDGGTEIKIGEQIVGFVEANEEFVTLRNAGSNINYQYQYIPPGLAVAMAELGTISDLSTWRLQKTALYCLYTHQENDLGDEVEKFLAQSEVDGHDVTLLREFLNDDFPEIVPPDKIDLPVADTAAELLYDLSPEYKIGEVEQLKIDEVRQLEKSVFLEARPTNPAQGVALLDFARRLAIRGANVYRMEDAILELSNRTNLDLADLYLESFSEISQRKLDRVEARKLMETAIPFLKSKLASELDQKDIMKLAKRLVNVAQKFQFADSLRRLNQLK